MATGQGTIPLNWWGFRCDLRATSTGHSKAATIPSLKDIVVLQTMHLLQLKQSYNLYLLINLAINADFIYDKTLIISNEQSTCIDNLYFKWIQMTNSRETKRLI